MKVLGIITARGGSKGIPSKNIKLLQGKPLLAYTLKAAKSSSLLNTCILSSDDTAIIEMAKEWQIEVPFIRPAALATDTAASLDVVLHAVDFFIQQHIYFDAVCILQPTSPFRIPGLIDACIEKMKTANADALFTAVSVPTHFNPHWVFEPDDDGFLHIATGEDRIIPQRQKLPPAFIRDGSVYLVKTSVLLNHQSLYGNKTAFVETDQQWYANIDTPNDWALAEQKATLFEQTFPAYFR